MNQVPVCLSHASEISEPNQDIVLAQGLLVISGFTSNDEHLSVEGIVFMQFLPQPRIVVELEHIDNRLTDKLDIEQSLKISIERFSFECMIVQTQTDSMRLIAIESFICQPETQHLNKATFYIVNFPMCHGQGVQRRNNPLSFSRSRIQLRDSGWIITLDKREDYQQIQEYIKQSDGYVLTYAGLIEREDNCNFTSLELLEQLKKLYLFLSFARGAFTAPIIIEGFSKEGSPIWKDWSHRRFDRWTLTQSNWLSITQTQNQLSELYPKWNRLMLDPLWEQEIPKVLYWYIHAGRNTQGAGTDGSLILATAALERLSFVLLVHKEKKLSNEKFKKRLAWSLRKALGLLEIPEHLPDTLSDFCKYSNGNNWQSGPQAVIELRNEIVHPDRSGTPGPYVSFGALQLALWYIEMMLLRLAGYEGEYSNRLKLSRWKGDVEMLPWKK